MASPKVSATFLPTSPARCGEGWNARDACAVTRATKHVPPPEAALAHNEPLVRQHAAWALGRIASAPAVDRSVKRCS